MAKRITRATARKVLELVDLGLTDGLGSPEPGKMCIEAAVCYALGEPHGDQPSCVSPALRAFKIRLNDSNWSSNEARAKGMRRLAIIQLGTAGVLDEIEFAKWLAKWVKEVVGSRATDVAAAAATADAAAAAAAAALYAADAARYAAAAALYAADAAHYAADAVRYTADACDKSFAQRAEEVVQILVAMKVPAVEWLDLAPLEE